MTHPPRFAVGQKASLCRKILDSDIRTMAEVTGDTNPLHLDEEYAATTRFGRRIAHGLFCSGLISAVLGIKLPGPGSIYLSETIDFRHPVFPGDRLTAEVEVTEWLHEKGILRLRTRCWTNEGVSVSEGNVVMMVR